MILPMDSSRLFNIALLWMDPICFFFQKLTMTQVILPIVYLDPPNKNSLEV